jgi:hypothetical protein
MMKKTALSLSLFLLAALMPAAPALADTVNLSLTTPVQTGAPSSTLTFDATVSAPLANGAPVFLNSDNFGVGIPGSTIDDSGFLTNFPLSLSPGDDFTGTLFTVTLPSNLASGVYSGFFEIFGGAAGAADPLATVDFQIDASSPVPEPGTWVLLATGLGILATWMWHRHDIAQGNAT